MNVLENSDSSGEVLEVFELGFPYLQKQRQNTHDTLGAALSPEGRTV